MARPLIEELFFATSLRPFYQFLVIGPQDYKVPFAYLVLFALELMLEVLVWFGRDRLDSLPFEIRWWCQFPHLFRNVFYTLSFGLPI